jgi:hypothetical protein
MYLMTRVLALVFTHPDQNPRTCRRTLTALGQERDDLQKQLNNMEHEIGDVLQQLATVSFMDFVCVS